MSAGLGGHKSRPGNPGSRYGQFLADLTPVETANAGTKRDGRRRRHRSELPLQLNAQHCSKEKSYSTDKASPD